VSYLIEDSEAKVMVTEKAFLETVLAVRDAEGPLETVIVVDGEGENDTLTVADVLEGATTTSCSPSAASRTSSSSPTGAG
jgi:hypothetical protein